MKFTKLIINCEKITKTPKRRLKSGKKGKKMAKNGENRSPIIPQTKKIGVKPEDFTPKMLHWEVLGSDFSHFFATFGVF